MNTTDRNATLEHLERDIWDRLHAATVDRDAPWRTPVLATSGDEGPDARTIVVREVDPARRRLLVYSDARAPKVSQARRDARAVLVFWSRVWSWQLRVRCTIEVHTEGDDVAARWARLAGTPAAQDYSSVWAPGATLSDDLSPHDSPHASPHTSSHPSPMASHFAVLEAQVHSMDWLALNRDGHRRVRFEGGRAVKLEP
jgi:pyridoxamine 5'-phosphate oxidase